MRIPISLFLNIYIFGVLSSLKILNKCKLHFAVLLHYFNLFIIYYNISNRFYSRKTFSIMSSVQYNDTGVIL